MYRRNSLKAVRTNKCSKVAGYERYKNQLYFVTLAMNNIKIKKIIPFTSTKRIKFRNKFNKRMQNLGLPWWSSG